MSDLRKARHLLAALTLVSVLAIRPLFSASREPEQPPQPPGATASVVAFSPDTRIRPKLDAARDYIRTRQWGEASNVLQVLLDAKEDQFFVKSIPAAARPSVVTGSLRAETLKLMGSLPPDALEIYNTQHNPKARSLLKEGRARDEMSLIAQVVERYGFTEAGADAALQLATHHLDRGRPGLAAVYFQHLLDRPDADRLAPETLFQAALAFRLAGDAVRQQQTLRRLEQRSPGGLTLDGRSYEPERLRALLERARPGQAVSAEWPTFRADVSRTDRGDGDVPLLEPVWKVSTLGPNTGKHWFENAQKAVGRQGRPLLPGGFPLGTGGRVVYRSHAGLHAADLSTGRELWKVSSAWSLDALARDSGKVVTSRNWLATLGDVAHWPFEMTAVGAPSSDGQRVYAIEELPWAPPPDTIFQIQANGMRLLGPFSDALFGNRLRAHDLETGAVLWEKGGKSGEFANSFFLGAPIAFQGRLHVLVEKDSEVRLVCLAPDRGEVLWSQRLGLLRDRVLFDPGRRSRGVAMTCADGLLVIPTDAGAVFAFDLVDRRLAWVFTYPSRRPAAGAEMPYPVFAAPLYEDSWKLSAPAVAQGKVVVAPFDADQAYCLDQHEGKLLWQVPRDGDLFLAGTFRGKVLSVGAARVRAFALDDGKPAWSRSTSPPAGQGVVGDGLYYLPVRLATGGEAAGGVSVLDVETGNVAGFVGGRGGDVVGNLAFCQGQVLSQTATGLAVYPQLRARLAQIDRRLAIAPDDVATLLERGALRLDQGEVEGALTDLRNAVAASEPGGPRGRAEERFHEAIVLATLREPGSLDRRLEELRRSCEVSLLPDADEAARVAASRERLRREANVLLAEARARDRQGRTAEAIARYLALIDRADFVPAVWAGEDAGWLPASPASTPRKPAMPRAEVWAQGRLTALVENPPAGQAADVRREVARRWEGVRAGNDLEALRRFVHLFGRTAGPGEQARLRYAERLAASGRSGLFEAEWHLRTLRQDTEDVALAARATEALARLATRAGELDDALTHYRTLQTEYATTELAPGRTGASEAALAREDKRFVTLAANPWGRSNYKVADVRGAFVPRVLALALEPEGDPPALLRRQRLVLDVGAGQIRMFDRDSGGELAAFNLSLGLLRSLILRAPPPIARIPCRVQGHLAVVQVLGQVVAIDLRERRMIWKRDLADRTASVPNQVYPDERGQLWVGYPDQLPHLIARPGPLERDGICVVYRGAVTCLDPLRGETLWTRPLPGDVAELLGDDRHVYPVEREPNGSLTLRRALRLTDGGPVELPVQTWQPNDTARMLGRTLILQRASQSPARVATVEMPSGKAVWETAAPSGGWLATSEKPTLTATLDRDGTCRVTDLRTRREMFRAVLEREHLTGLQSLTLVADAERLYLVLNRGITPKDAIAMAPVPHIMGGLRSVPAHGTLYAFDRATGAFRWHNSGLVGQQLLLERFDDCPLLLFTAMVIRQTGPSQAQFFTVAALDRSTGKTVLQGKEYPFTNNPFHAVQLNPAAGTVEMLSRPLKVRFTIQP